MVIVRRPSALDVGLVALAVTLGAAHLTFAPGREHSAAAYAGLEWLRGASPYAQLQTQEGPGLLMLHGVLRVLGGEVAAFRFVALLASLGTGWVAPAVALGRDEPVPRGGRGFSTLVASLLAHGYFDFWHSGRGSTFALLAILGSAALLLRGRRRARWAVVAGALFGVGLSIRPLHLTFLPLLLGAASSTGEARKRVPAFLAGALLLASLLVIAMGPSGTEHAFDLIVRGRCLYFGARFLELPSVRVIEHFQPVAGVLLGLFALGALLPPLGVADRLLGRRAFVLGWGLCAYLSVALANTFAPFENEAFISFGALVAALIARDLSSWFSGHPGRAVAIGAAQLVALHASAYADPASASATLTRRARAAAAYARGAKDRAEYRESFAIPELSFFPGEIERVAAALYERVRPEETVVVRGYEPEVYLRARVRYGGRFFWTGHLQWEGCEYRRDEWLRRDEDELRGLRPDWVVAKNVPHGIDAAAGFEARGYKVELRSEHMTLLRRR